MYEGTMRGERQRERDNRQKRDEKQKKEKNGWGNGGGTDDDNGLQCQDGMKKEVTHSRHTHREQSDAWRQEKRTREEENRKENCVVAALGRIKPSAGY
jgi:hypothetical protein